jgi:putative SOS response-associated peptidase YedK
MTRNGDAIRCLFRVDVDRTANQPPLPAIFPDQFAPVVRIGHDGTRVMETMRWGFPPPPNFGTRPVMNVRNTASPYWRGWLKPEFRCLVPATSFCEYTGSQPKIPHWFALNGEHEPFAFAGIWRPLTGTRKGETGEHLLFAFLTTAPNDAVRPAHSKAMPVILAGSACDIWLEADTATPASTNSAKRGPPFWGSTQFHGDIPMFDRQENRFRDAGRRSPHLSLRDRHQGRNVDHRHPSLGKRLQIVPTVRRNGIPDSVQERRLQLHRLRCRGQRSGRCQSGVWACGDAGHEGYL